jgi:hypothetical protein
MNWLAALWRQFFREERVIEPLEFLHANRTLGLFSTLVLYICLSQPERSHPVFTLLVGLTVATHLGGQAVAAFAPRVLEPTLFVQGAALGLSSLGFIVMSTWLSLQSPLLSNVRYVPGIALMLLIQATLELHLFGPAPLRRWPMRRAGLVIGIVGELAMAGGLLQRLGS